MPKTLEEEARSCPRCDNFGQLVSTHAGPRGSTVRTYMCGTQGCKWYSTTWIVQVNSDGSIPVRNKDRDDKKDFPDFTFQGGQRGRDIVNQLREMHEQSKRGSR